MCKFFFSKYFFLPTLFTVWQVWYDTNDVSCRGSFASIGRNQHFHDHIVDIPKGKAVLENIY